MNDIHLEINRRLAKVDFNRIYPGFHSFRFAIYNNTQVYFQDTEIPWDTRFTGNTAINYNGEWIAIWNLNTFAGNLDSLTSKIVHEMFHAYQNEMGDTRWPDEIVGAFYPRDLRNFELKYREDQLLASLAEKFDKAVWQEFKTLRASRIRLYPKAVDYEIKTEGIEGAATYAELQVLKVLDATLYREEFKKCISSLRTTYKIFDIRLLSYSTGCIIHTIRNGNALEQIDWSQATPGTREGPGVVLPDLRVKHREYYEDIDKRIQDVLARAEKLDLGETTLLLFDPYNVRFSGDYLYHPHFLGYGTHELPVNFLKGAYITRMKSRTRTIEEIWHDPRV